MRKLLISFFLCCLFMGSPAIAQVASSGLFIQSGTSGIPNPTANLTWVLDSSDQSLKVWNGAAWVKQTPPKSNYTATIAPTVSNDNTQGYLPGSIWYDSTHLKLYYTTDVTTGAAVWNQFGTGGSGTGGILSGTIIPDSTIGVDGSFYIKTDTMTIYGPRVAGNWGSPTSLASGPTGPTGPTGPSGSNGSNGTAVLNGTINPTSGVGQNGDFYINTTSEIIFGPKSAGAWPGSGFSLGSGGVSGVDSPDSSITVTSGSGPTVHVKLPGSSGLGTNQQYGTNNGGTLVFSADPVVVGAVVGQALLCQGTGTPQTPVYGAINLAGGGSIVSGILPISNLPDAVSTTFGSLSPLFTASASGHAVSFALTPATNPSWYGCSGSTTPAYQAAAMPVALIPFASPAAIGSGTPAAIDGTTITPHAGFAPSAAGTLDIGSTAKWFRDLYFGNATGFYFHVSGTPTANRSIFVPDTPSAIPSGMASSGSTWLKSFSSSTGQFTQTQPASTDLTDASSLATLTGAQTLTNKSIDAGQLTGTINKSRLPTSAVDATSASNLQVPVANGVTGYVWGSRLTAMAKVASKWLDSATADGVFTQSQPASTNLSDAASLAYLASPAFTGTPTAPTASTGTNTTQIATCAFVIANSGTHFTSTDQAITSGATYTLAHGLSTTPTRIWYAIVCQTAQQNYSIGDVVYGPFCTNDSSPSQSINFTSDGTNVYGTMASTATPITLINKTTGNRTSAVLADWKLRVFATPFMVLIFGFAPARRRRRNPLRKAA